MQYRKKPVVIEAVQLTAEFLSPNENTRFPSWWIDAVNDNVISPTRPNDFNREHVLAVHTLEGTIYADKGDWIIRGVKGELYPCKPDVFAITYEPV